MEIIKPKKLKVGDTIGILAISGRIKEYERIENAAKYFKMLGYNVVISDTCKTFHRYMAGKNDDDCVNALHNFFEDKNINAIVCARGGYGTLRLLDKIDWDLIKNNPKIFAGYSDITTLLTMIFKKTGLITFHSAMANGDFGLEIEQYTKNSFFNTLKGMTKEIKAESSLLYSAGDVKGLLWGGNLATLTALSGIDFVPNEDLILFLEDLNEPVYKIDRMLTQLFNIKDIRKNVKGIALGEFRDVDNLEMFDEVILEIAQKYKITIAKGFKITHGKVKDSIPVGTMSKLTMVNRNIEFLDKYVI